MKTNRADGHSPLIAALVGIVVSIIVFYSQSRALHPAIWDDATAALGLRIPQYAFPGIWCGVIKWLSTIIGDFSSQFKTSLLLISVVLSFVTTFLCYMALLDVVPIAVRNLRGRAARWGLRAALTAGAIALNLNHAVLRMFCGGTSSQVHWFLIVLGLFLTGRFFATSMARFVYGAFVVWGVLCGDNPAGFLFLALTIRVVTLKGQMFAMNDDSDFVARPIARTAFILFAVAFAVTFLFDLNLYGELGGIEASDNVFINAVGLYLKAFVVMLKSSISWMGLLSVFVFAVSPLIVVGSLQLKFWDGDGMVSRPMVAACAIAGFIAATQIGCIHEMSLFSWGGDNVPVKSDLASAIVIAMGTLTVIWALAPIFTARSQRLRMLATVLSVALIVWVLPSWKMLRLERGMLEDVADYCHETADECADRKIVFTDGALDAGVELAAFESGRQLTALSMMSGTSAREIALRQRFAANEEQKDMLRSGAADMLRFAVYEQKDLLPDIALQLGLELWQRGDSGAFPALSGTVALPMASSEKSAETEVEKARTLASRVISRYQQGDPDSVFDWQLRSAFRFVQWRLARMCAERSKRISRSVWDEKSKQEQELASRLDEYNLPYRNAKKQFGWMSDRGDFRLTPREGLRLALARADFKMARSFAKTVLASDPDNAQANFALGMGYFLEERYPLAESHLKRCLEKKPKEPAVLNNLAVIALRLGRANEALEYAQRAFEVAPESADIKRTLEKARTAVSNTK